MEHKFFQIAWKHCPGAMAQTSLDAIDSLELGSFILDVEDEFDIDLSDEALHECKTFGDVLIILQDSL
jgi:acyl carrier protein